jgi:hypothetical protein
MYVPCSRERGCMSGVDPACFWWCGLTSMGVPLTWCPWTIMTWRDWKRASHLRSSNRTRTSGNWKTHRCRGAGSSRKPKYVPSVPIRVWVKGEDGMFLVVRVDAAKECVDLVAWNAEYRPVERVPFSIISELRQCAWSSPCGLRSGRDKTACGNTGG